MNFERCFLYTAKLWHEWRLWKKKAWVKNYFILVRDVQDSKMAQKWPKWSKWKMICSKMIKKKQDIYNQPIVWTFFVFFLYLLPSFLFIQFLFVKPCWLAALLLLLLYCKYHNSKNSPCCLVTDTMLNFFRTQNFWGFLTKDLNFPLFYT